MNRVTDSLNTLTQPQLEFLYLYIYARPYPYLCILLPNLISMMTVMSCVSVIKLLVPWHVLMPLGFRVPLFPAHEDRYSIDNLEPLSGWQKVNGLRSGVKMG